MTNLNLIACSNSTCSGAPLSYNSSTGVYGYTGASTNFIRKIQVTPNYSENSNETQITSTVYWQQGSGTYNVSLSEVLYNWVQ